MSKRLKSEVVDSRLNWNTFEEEKFNSWQYSLADPAYSNVYSVIRAKYYI